MNRVVFLVSTVLFNEISTPSKSKQKTTVFKVFNFYFLYLKHKISAVEHYIRANFFTFLRYAIIMSFSFYYN